MQRFRLPFTASLLLLALSAAPLRAGIDEAATVLSATEVLRELSSIPLRGIPPALLQDARGVAIIPNVIKAGFVLGGRFGRGVILVRQPDGSWGNPIFLTLAGGGIGWQVGVQSTDVVLVFKTNNGLERILRGQGKVTLGADMAVAAGPVGRQAEASTDGMLRAEIYSYSRSRGLFAGVSLEGAGLLIDFDANEEFYRVRGGRPSDIQNTASLPVPAVAVQLRAELSRLSAPGAPPPPVVPAPAVPPVVVPKPPAPAVVVPAPPAPPPAVLPPAPVPIPR
jgi:lipid-binding SYLF domain-containing protein